MKHRLSFLNMYNIGVNNSDNWLGQANEIIAQVYDWNIIKKFCHKKAGLNSLVTYFHFHGQDFVMSIKDRPVG